MCRRHARRPGPARPRCPAASSADFARFAADFHAAHPWLPPALAHRLARAYGTRAERILAGATSLSGLGEPLGAGLTAAEVDYLVNQEWARTSTTCCGAGPSSACT